MRVEKDNKSYNNNNIERNVEECVNHLYVEENYHNLLNMSPPLLSSGGESSFTCSSSTCHFMNLLHLFHHRGEDHPLACRGRGHTGN